MASLLLLYLGLTFSNGQQCLSSPQSIRHDATGNDIEWTQTGPNTFEYTLTFDASTKSWPDPSINAQIRTRLFNDAFPSQTLRFKRGNTYKITVINALGPESPQNPVGHNIQKDPNTTNIHTHGLHLSGERPSDNVYVKIDPGQQYVYEYHIPCDHSGGLFWWHPHHHGSTHIQVAAGAAGALVMEDDKVMEGLPDWYTDMEELIFFVTHIHLLKYGQMLNTENIVESVWEYTNPSGGRPGNIDTFFVNGEFQPTVCMQAGAWVKFRFAQVETTEKSRIYSLGDGECTLYLLARDGVMVHGMNDTDMPRAVGSGVWLTQASRADVAISCPGSNTGSATYEIWVDNSPLSARQVIAYIEVTGTATSPLTQLTPFTPIRPSYLENLVDGYYTGNLRTQRYPDPDRPNAVPLDYWKGMLVTGAAIGGSQFVDETNYLQYIDINTINTWEVTNSGNNLHPLHVHVNHFQMISSQLGDLNSADFDNWVDIPDGFQAVGDFFDTIWGPSWIRFKTDIFAGTVTMHCHILIHEDQGAMGSIKINNGCDSEFNDYSGDNSCDYTADKCDSSITSAPTTTAQPSTTSTARPSTPTPTQRQVTNPPNVLVIVVDDLPYTADWSHSSPAGTSLNNGVNVRYPTLDTPNIQSFLDDGAVIMPRTYTAGPICSPSRYSTLTGRFPTRCTYAITRTANQGREYNGTYVELLSVSIENGDDAIYNLPYTLKNDANNPFFTGMAGKWHLMDPSTSQSIGSCAALSSTPNAVSYENCKGYVKDQGFDSVEAWYHGNLATTSFFSHNPEWMVSETKKMINEAVNVENKPFFIYFPLTLVHDPSALDALENFSDLQTPMGELTGNDIPSSTGMKTRATLLSEVNALNTANDFQKDLFAGLLWMDDTIGALLDYLKDPSIDQYDNTFIVLMNDHGQGAKNTLYEQGSRIMQFIRYPPLYSGSSPYIMPQSFISSNVDFAATIFDITGVVKPSSYIIDGKSWYDDAKDIIDGATMDNTCCNERFSDLFNSHSIMTENYQYIWRASSSRSAQADNYLNGADVEQLYDLNADPNQQNNVISDSSLSDIVCDFRRKMIDHVTNAACAISQCKVPDLGNCEPATTSNPTPLITSDPTNVPTKSPTITSTLTPTRWTQTPTRTRNTATPTSNPTDEIISETSQTTATVDDPINGNGAARIPINFVPFILILLLIS